MIVKRNFNPEILIYHKSVGLCCYIRIFVVLLLPDSQPCWPSGWPQAGGAGLDSSLSLSLLSVRLSTSETQHTAAQVTTLFCPLFSPSHFDHQSVKCTQIYVFENWSQKMRYDIVVSRYRQSKVKKAVVVWWYKPTTKDSSSLDDLLNNNRRCLDFFPILLSIIEEIWRDLISRRSWMLSNDEKAFCM